MHRVPKPEFARTPGLYEDLPVVVEEILSTKETNQWLNKVLDHAKEEEILVQFENDLSQSTMPLSKATQVCMEHSSHQEPIYCSSVGHTGSPAFTQEVPMEQLVETLFVNEYTAKEDNLDWFQAVKQYAPVHDTLIVAGEGATSPTMQCHAYSKMMLCIDGSQLIRVLPPLGAKPNELLRDWASPTYMEAWNGFPVSNGYRANPKHDLFAFRHRDVSWELEQMSNTETKQSNRYDQFFQHWAEDPNVFHPNFEVEGTSATTGGQNHHDLWHSTVLLPGDMVMIPPGWWYQTYNVEPSVTLGTQRCGGSRMASRFIHHALETSGVDRMLQLDKEGGHTMEEALTIVSGLFEVLDEHYHSDNRGAKKNP